MGKAQEKFLKLLDLLNGCREKLYATYNLFVANLEQTKQTKLELGEKYEQLLDIKNDFAAAKPTKTRANKLKRDSLALKQEYDTQFNSVGEGMADCEMCRKTYKHEVALCCDTYNKLKENNDSSSVVKGYRSQIKIIKRILEKMESIKTNYKGIRQEIIRHKAMFDDLYNKLNEQALELVG